MQRRNTRVHLDRVVDDSSLDVVWECEIKVPPHRGHASTNSRILFATAGYKDRILIGTERMYEGGHMNEFNPSTGIWYRMMQSNSADVSVFMYRKDSNLYAYVGYDIPWNFNPRLDPMQDTVTENLLFTPIELLALDKLKKEAKIEFKRKLKVYSCA